MLLVTSIAAAPAAPVSNVAPDDAPSLVDDLAIGELPPREQAIVERTGQDPVGTGLPDACQERTPHPPIRITEDHGPQGFTWTDPVTGETEPRPASGVVGGSGTEADPFVIAGWCIPVPGDAPSTPVVSPPPAPPGILVLDTAAHAVIQDTVIWDGTGEGAGIGVQEAENVSIVRNLVQGAQVGVHLLYTQGTTVRSNNLTGNAAGLIGWFTPETVLRDNVVRGSAGSGIFLAGSSRSTVHNNTIVENARGVFLLGSPEVSVRGNVATDNGVDIRASGSSHSEIVDNTLGTGIRLGGLTPNPYIQTVRNNTVAGRPLIYLLDVDDPTLPEEIGQLVIVDVTNLSVSDVDIQGAALGIHVVFSHNVTVNGTDLAGNREGIRVRSSTDVVVRNTSIRDTRWRGVEVAFSDDVTIRGNDVTGSGGSGIMVFDVPQATVDGNRIEGNDRGVYLWVSDGTVVRENVVTGNGEGIRIEESGYLIEDPRPSIRNNTIRDNGDGVVVELSRAELRHNLIRDNEERGIVLRRSPPDRFGWVNVHDNNIAGNAIGLDSAQSDVNATRNWWGHTTGPGGGAWDACVQEPSAGLGDPIRWLPGRVCFTPWRGTPDPDAGPG